MKLILSLGLLISFIAAASASEVSNAKNEASRARECHHKIGKLATNKVLSLNDQAQLATLKERLESFVAAETGCNEETEIRSVARFECYTELYSNESLDLIKTYRLANNAARSVCL